MSTISSRIVAGLLLGASSLLACGGSDSETGPNDAATSDGHVVDSGADDGGPELPLETGDGVKRESTAIDGVDVDRYTWMDSHGRSRSVSLKRQGASNGGYAVQLTYEVPDGEGWRTVSVDGTGGGEEGFGYFVAHERYRTFDDNSSGTIAALHGEDDSPLGLGFAVIGSHSAIEPTSTSVSHTFTSTYPKWGTTVPMVDVDAQTPKASEAHRKFNLPLTIRWTFQKGTDFPRIDVKLDLGEATAGQLAFDVRGPYGVLEFADTDRGATINNVQWGDSAFHFTTRAAASGDLTTDADWVWSEPVGTARPYHALFARHAGTGVLYEIGLFELKLGSDPGLVYGNYSENRGTTKAGSGRALLSDAFGPGDWPFQSAQYSGLGATPITGKKFAWGSSALYGSQSDSQFLNAAISVPLVAFPSSKTLVYRTCLVSGLSTFSDADRRGLTRQSAESAAPSCASANPL